MQIMAGQIIALTTGEYSDYGLRDHVRCIRAFESDEIIAEFKETNEYLVPPSWAPEDEPTAYGADDRFIAWLIRLGFIEPLDDDAVVEWHIGSYGRLGD